MFKLNIKRCLRLAVFLLGLVLSLQYAVWKALDNGTKYLVKDRGTVELNIEQGEDCKRVVSTRIPPSTDDGISIPWKEIGFTDTATSDAVFAERAARAFVEEWNSEKVCVTTKASTESRDSSTRTASKLIANPWERARLFLPIFGIPLIIWVIFPYFTFLPNKVAELESPVTY